MNSRYLLTSLFCAWVAAATAETNSPFLKLQNLIIQSDNGADWDLNTGLAIFRGNVRVTDAPAMLLKCEILTAKFAADGSTNQNDTGMGAVENIVAEQSVTIDFVTPQGIRHATGEKAVYTATNDLVELTGNPAVVTIPQGRITGPVVILDRKNNKFRVPRSFRFESSTNFTGPSLLPAPPKK